MEDFLIVYLEIFLKKSLEEKKTNESLMKIFKWTPESFIFFKLLGKFVKQFLKYFLKKA